jgi:calcineurin-like phosphoesterase family protein
MKPGDFVTSDHHFGHKNIIKFCNRPFMKGIFPDVEGMDEFLIDAWNSKVPQGATVYYLGDFGFVREDRLVSILGRLNGNKLFIRGNHDKNIRGHKVMKHIGWIKDYYETHTPDKTKIVMCHYPMMSWNGGYRGSWMLHGHSHGNMGPQTKRILDVGVDTRDDFAPYSYEEIAKIISKRDKRGCFENIADKDIKENVNDD